MQKKLFIALLVIFMAVGCITASLTPSVLATVQESVDYQFDKKLSKDQSSVTIVLYVNEQVKVNQVTLPDGMIVKDDLTQYSYDVTDNGNYEFDIEYIDEETSEILYETVSVEVTEITETEVPSNVPVAEVPSNAVEVPDDSLDVVYVSANGDDTTGDGSQGTPFATLSYAVKKASDGATIYVMSDLTMNSTARYYGKDLTITSGNGGPYTLTRGDDFAQVQDAARSTYNPALIEVDSTDGPNTASLTLTHIILDDAGKKEGSYFVQADSEGDGHTTVGSKEVPNTDIVQDGIIATYNGVATITLGNGAILKNYGGMSAVRLASGVLVMEEGSQIIDDKTITREKGTSGSFGPAGALWLQGGTLNMKGGIIGGSDGAAMNGRAVYVDGGTATIGGTIQNITGTDAAWQGQNGIAVHLRSGGEATLTSTGKINNVTGKFSGNNSAIWSQYCNFTADKGSYISKVDGIPVVHFDDLGQDYKHKIFFDGTISDCNSGESWLYRSWYGLIELGENGVIENCQTSNAGGLIYSNNGSHYVIRGTIQKNKSLRLGFLTNAIIYMANQGGGTPECTIESTAHIIDNTGLGIRVNNSSLVIMNGGEISRNSSYGVQVSGKADWRGVTFIMNGGTIADNGGVGISYTVAGESLVELNGGTISGNGSGNYQISASGGYAVAERDGKNGYEYIHVSSSVLGDIRGIYVSAGTVILPEGYADVNLGRATSQVVAALEKEVNERYAGWSKVGSSALWIQPSATEFSFEFDPLSTPEKRGLYVVYMPVNDDGTPQENADVTIEEVENVTQIPITLKNLTANQAYAVMLFNNNEYTLVPDDITIYIGGGQGDETYDNGGFPDFTIVNSVDVNYSGELKSLTIKGQEMSTDDGRLIDQLMDHLEVTYTDEDGKVVTDDRQVGEYTATLSWKNGLKDEDVLINGNIVTLSDEGGRVIVRHISDKKGAISGTITHPLVTEDEITSKVEHATAIANGSNPRFYINNDSSRTVSDVSGIQLLDDSLLLEDENDNRQELMEEKAKEYLQIQDELGTFVHFDFHYLDLVDAYNGNAWVSASSGTTVYLPYPEGTDETTNFSLVHYKDLHREYGISGQADVEEAIRNCELETIEFEPTEFGIRFSIPRSGFSPFALVWSEETGSSTITVQYVDKDLNELIQPSYVVELTNGDTYDITEAANVAISGYHIDSIDTDQLSGIVSEDLVVNVYYKNDAPVIYAKDQLLTVGDSFDPMEGVYAADTEDQDLSAAIQVTENTVSTTVPGTYYVTYQVSDSLGKTAEKTIQVIVKEKEDVTPPTDNESNEDNEEDNPSVDDGDTMDDDSKDDGSVKTSDHSQIVLYSFAAVLSIAIAGLLLIKRERRSFK